MCLFFLLVPDFVKAAVPNSAASHGQRWIMAVGICKFADTRIPQLKYCVDDARAIARYFEKDNVAKDHITVLVNEDASRDAIINSLQKMAVKIGKDDSFFFFYSSHGAGDDSDTTYFITFDTDHEDFASTALPMQGLKDMIKKIKCYNIVMMIDTCHSGGVKSLGRQDEKAFSKLVRIADKETRIAILTSSRTHESSMEAERWSHGAFTYYMLDGLTGNADNFPPDGRVSVTELFDYVMIAVPRATSRAQHPSAKFSYNWPGEKDQAVKVGKTIRNYDNPGSAPQRTGSQNSGPMTVYGNHNWRNGKPKKKNPPIDQQKKWHNVIE
jgi:uncharacterized caspase-like protein